MPGIARLSPAEMEHYFRERERLRAQGASADHLRGLSERHGASHVALSRAAEPAYVSLGDARPDGIVVTGRDTRDAYALAERRTLRQRLPRPVWWWRPCWELKVQAA